jgi:hypothetical protein
VPSASQIAEAQKNMLAAVSAAADVRANERLTAITDAQLSGGTVIGPSTDAFTKSFNDYTQSNPIAKIPTTRNNTAGAKTFFYGDYTPYWMSFEVYEYKRLKPLDNTLANPLYTISLPLPDGEGLNDSTTAQWNDSALTHWGNALDNSSKIQSMIGGFLESGKNGTISDPTTDPGVKSAFGSDVLIYAADAAARSASPELAGVAESLTGLAPNPALAMTFKQVDFRKFQFTWLLSPKNENETNQLNKIIRLLKQAHLPNFTAGSTAIFNYPYIVKPRIGPDEAQKYMTDFMPSVITAINVRYSPVSKAPSFYSGTKAPVFIELSIALEEMQIRTPGNYATDDGNFNKPDHSEKNAVEVVQTTTGVGALINGNGNQGAKRTNPNPTTPGVPLAPKPAPIPGTVAGANF